MPTYPGAFHVLNNPLTTQFLNTPLSHAAQHGNANDAIEEIEVALGLNPQGGSADVAARFATLQPLDADLTAIAALASAADKLPYATGAQAWSLTDFVSAGRDIVGNNVSSGAILGRALGGSGAVQQLNSLDAFANLEFSFQFQLNTPFGWRTISKATTETRTNNSTLASDATLFLNLQPNITYRMRMVIFYDVEDGGGFKYSIAGPVAPTRIRIKTSRQERTSAVVDTVEKVYTPSTTVTVGAEATDGCIEIDLIIENGANQSDLAFLWAQNSVDANNTSVLKGSYLDFKIV